MDLATLLAQAVDLHASDIHLMPDTPPLFRVAGTLTPRPETAPLDEATMASLILPALADATRHAFADGITPSAEAVLSSGDNALDFHLWAFRTEGRLAATIRVGVHAIPTLEQIGGTTTEFFRRLADETRRGLLLFTGPTGSGKATTAYAFSDEINALRSERIFLITEMPVYRMAHKQSYVTRWQVGQDVETFEQAARNLWKVDPDVVYFGDLPTLEAVRQALLLADAGHVVVANLASESAVEAIENLVQAFAPPAHLTAQTLLARTLVAVVNQRLLRRASGTGRVAAYEILLGTPPVQAAIRAGADRAALQAALDNGVADGQRSLAHTLSEMVASGEITLEARDAAL